MSRTLLLLVLLPACQRPPERDPAPAPPSESERAAGEGRARLAMGDRSGALKAFERAAAAGPAEPHARLGHAATALADGDVESARAHLAALRGAGQDPAALAPWLTAAIDGAQVLPAREDAPAPVQPTAKRADGAPSTTATAPESPEDKELAEMFRSGRLDEVARRIAAESEPSLFRRKLLADAWYNLERWEKAAQEYRQVLRREPGNEPVTQYLADALFRLGRYDDSMAFYRVLAEAHPDRPGFWRLIGDAAVAKGDDALALAAYAKAIERGYESPELQGTVDALKRKMEP